MSFADPTIKKTGSNSYDVSYGDDSSVYAEFEQVAVKNEFKSAQEGRPVFDDRVFLRILFPGDKTKVVFRPVKEEDKLRFSKQWAAFEKQEEQVATGTPITEWAPLTKGEAMSLKAMNVMTVEMLAALPDTALTWLGGRVYRDKAITWLANAKNGAEALKLKAENDTLKADVEALKAQIQEIANLKKKESK